MAEKMLKVKITTPHRQGFQHYGSAGRMWPNGMSEHVLAESYVEAMKAEVARQESILIIEIVGPAEQPKAETPKK